MIPTFTARRQSWSHPPVDDVGYVSSRELLAAPAQELRTLIANAESNRYGGWRNYRNLWRKTLRLDETHDKVVLDYGCGIGIEALQYARTGNEVIVADISRDNVRLAMRVLELEGFSAGAFQITKAVPVNSLFGNFDVIHCAGVLHHIPDARRVVQAMAARMSEGGELRLMVYSDEAWRIACGTEPPDRVEDDPGFHTYWTHWDAVGGYADWYDPDKLVERFGQWFDLVEWSYLTERHEYLGARMVKR